MTRPRPIGQLKRRPAHLNIVGIDVGKDLCVTTILTKTGRIKKRIEFANRPAGFAELEKQLKPNDELVIEAGTYVYALHDHFASKGFKVFPAHPRGIKQITESDKKTDRHDSEVLAHLHRVGYLPRAYIPHPEILRNRELLRTRLDMSYQSTRTKTKIKSFLAKQGLDPPENLFDEEGRAWFDKQQEWGDSRDFVLEIMLQDLDDLQRRRARIDALLADLAIESEDVKLLMSIVGIDYYLALVVASEVGDVERFTSKEAFRSYAGCAPKMRESAGKNRATGTNRSKSPRLKMALSLAAQTAVRYDNPVKDAFDKRLARTNRESRAYAVARRKMCDLVFTILKTREPCRWGNPSSVERKMKKLEKITGRVRGPPTPP